MPASRAARIELLLHHKARKQLAGLQRTLLIRTLWLLVAVGMGPSFLHKSQVAVDMLVPAPVVQTEWASE